jgi:hypothetical protein
VRVRIYKAGSDEAKETSPQFAPLKPAPGTSTIRRVWQAYFAGKNSLDR